jgi:2',3'-cyclic-nucleotide 2'-phosphodiesterase (5'-nucleotidase family)
VNKGVVTGYSDNSLKPKASSTTTQIVSIIVNARFPVVTTLHTNDFHSYLLDGTDATTKKLIGGSARIVTVVENERAYNPRTILVDAGGAIGEGPNISNFFKGENVIEVYNAIGYDYATFGNHEFNWGKDLLKERMSEAKYKYVSANIIDTSTKSAFAPEAYTIKNVGFVNIGFFGVDITDLPVLVNPKGIEGLSVKDPVTATNSVVRTFLDKVDYLVALSHLGYDVDKATYAPSISGVNLVIGGHSHTVLTKPDVVNGIPIVQTGNYGNDIGKVVLEFQTTADGTKLLNMNCTLIPINDSIPEDPTIKALIIPYNDQLKEKLDEKQRSYNSKFSGRNI